MRVTLIENGVLKNHVNMREHFPTITSGKKTIIRNVRFFPTRTYQSNALPADFATAPLAFPFENEVARFDVTAEHRPVGENHMVADVAVVRHMGTNHQQAVVTDRGILASVQRAVQRDVLANDVARTDPVDKEPGHALWQPNPPFAGGTTRRGDQLLCRAPCLLDRDCERDRGTDRRVPRRDV